MNLRFEWINWSVRVVRNETESYDTDSNESDSESDSDGDTGVSYDTPPPAVRSASRMRGPRVRAESGHGAHAGAHNAAERPDAGVGAADDRRLMTDGGRTAKADIDDPELLSALEEAEEEHGSMAEALRHAVRTTYVAEEEAGPTVPGDIPRDLRDGYAALINRYGTGSRVAIESAKSVIAQATKTPSEETKRTVIEPLRQRGYLGIHTGIKQVGVIIRERPATDGGRDRDADGLDDSDTDEVDVAAEFDRLESATAEGGESR